MGIGVFLQALSSNSARELQKRIYLMIYQRFVLLEPLLCILTFKGWSSMVASILTEGHLRVPPSDKKHCSWGMQSIMYAAAHFPLSISSLRNKQTNRIYWVEALFALRESTLYINLFTHRCKILNSSLFLLKFEFIMIITRYCTTRLSCHLL